MGVHIVLVEPEIPQNTGNIARSCVAAGTPLHLIQPLGFSLDSRYLLRAGMDYWDSLELHLYNSITGFLSAHPSAILRCATTRATTPHTRHTYPDGTFILFGKESAGLPVEFLNAHLKECIRIPMVAGTRSLNLSSSVAVCLYEALRQQDFPGLEPPVLQ